MLAAGIAPRPTAALNEPPPFVGPVPVPKPADPTAIKLTPAGEKVATKAALAAEAFKKKHYQAPPKPPSSRATMTHELTMGEKNQDWAEKYLAIPGNATQYNGLFAPTTQKTPAQVLAENRNKTPGGLAAQLQLTADQKAASTIAVRGALGAKPRFPAV
jgi:hypothetical protein